MIFGKKGRAEPRLFFFGQTRTTEMKQTTEAFSGQKNCVTPASAIRRFLAACMAFTLSVAPAFAQEAEDEKGVFDQVDAAAGWVVGKIGGVFFYPIWTFDKVGDQVKEVKTEAGGSGYAVGDIVVIVGGKTADKTALETVEELIEKIKIKDHYTNKDNPDDYERLENIQEFVSSVSDFSDRNENNGIGPFIEEVSLLTDIDRWNANEQKLTLMTLHSSKGLEFKSVYILGAEEGLLPLTHNNDDDDLEEERRLFYVGVTRGIKKVSISYANSRRRFGVSSMFSLRSSFIDAIPPELCSLNSSSNYSKQLTSKIAKPFKLKDEFKINDMVTHKLYGNGKIINIQGIGENSKISIKFRGNMIKKFIKKYANLKNIN